MKASSKDFTSVVSLLIKAGYTGFRVTLERGVGAHLRGGTNYVWFPALQIFVALDSNVTMQIRRDEEGEWWYRKNRKNKWEPMKDREGGKEFKKLIEPHYVKFLSDLMMGAVNVKSEGCSLQSGDGEEAIGPADGQEIGG